MELRHLRAFVMLAEELHFGRAAERLGIAQPQLSQWIRQLEAELAVPLFERSTRSVRLTDAGQAILEPARGTVRSAKLVSRAAALGSKGVAGRVTIGYAGAGSREVLPPVARAVRNEQPGIELVLQSMVYGGHAPAQVAAGTIDIGFSRLPIGRGDVETRIFAYERIVAALPADHPLAARPELELRDLAQEPFITFPATLGSNVRDAMMRLAHEAGFAPKIFQEAPDSYAILGLVAAGVGVTLTISSVQHIATPGLVYRDLAGPQRHLAAVVVWRRHNPTRATRTVLEIMERVLPTPPADPGHVFA